MPWQMRHTTKKCCAISMTCRFDDKCAYKLELKGVPAMTLRQNPLGRAWKTRLKTTRRTVLGSAAGLAILVSGGAGATTEPAPMRIAATSYSASGTHQCRGADGSAHSCVVTGAYFGSCIEATSSLRTQDCCPSTRLCERDAQGRETQCRRGGTSTGFAVNYCIEGR
jgi:hypothetical protein